MLDSTRKFLLDMAERAAKSFLQGYFATWILLAGIGDGVGAGGSDAFDTLFTLNNVKAGVVMAALSIGTSYVSKPIGSNSSASLVE